MVNRLHNFLSFGHLVIWSSCHPVMWSSSILSPCHRVILVILIFVLF